MWEKLIAWIKSLFEKKPDNTVQEDADEIDVATEKIKTFEASSKVLQFKKVNSIKRMWLDSLFRWELAKPRNWKDVVGVNGCIWCFLKQEDGTWYAAPGDMIRPGQDYKNKADVKVYIGNDTVLRPKNGEEIGIMFSTLCRHNVYKNGEERTNIKKFVWGS